MNSTGADRPFLPPFSRIPEPSARGLWKGRDGGLLGGQPPPTRRLLPAAHPRSRESARAWGGGRRVVDHGGLVLGSFLAGSPSTGRLLSAQTVHREPRSGKIRPTTMSTSTPTRLLTLLLAIAVSLAACGSANGDEGTPVPDRGPDVLAEPDQVALSYTVSGGIAGDTAIELIVFGDGAGTVRTYDSSPQDVLVTQLDLNQLLGDLEALGIHDVDPSEHPEAGIADGFGTDITVHTVNGTSTVGWYGMGEAPDLFDPDWRAMDAALAAFAETVLSTTGPSS